MGVKCLAWAEAYTKCSKDLIDDVAVIIEGKVEAADGSDVTVIVNEVRRVEEQIARASRSVSIALPAVGVDEQFLDDIFAVLSGSPGRTDVFLEMRTDGVITKLQAPALSVQGSAALERRLADTGCSVKWSL